MGLAWKSSKFSYFRVETCTLLLRTVPYTVISRIYCQLTCTINTSSGGTVVAAHPCSPISPPSPRAGEGVPTTSTEGAAYRPIHTMKKAADRHIPISAASKVRISAAKVLRTSAVAEEDRVSGREDRWEGAEGGRVLLQTGGPGQRIPHIMYSQVNMLPLCKRNVGNVLLRIASNFVILVFHADLKFLYYGLSDLLSSTSKSGFGNLPRTIGSKFF